MAYDQKFMDMAVELSIKNIDRGGGPFAAVIVKDGQLVSSEGNSVTLSFDPTAHAEVNAIRSAGKSLATHDLSGCELYSSCEPCPMCLSAIYWSGIEAVYYGNTKVDAEKAGFRDAHIYRELNIPNEKKSITLQNIPGTNAIDAFNKWQKVEEKTEY